MSEECDGGLLLRNNKNSCTISWEQESVLVQRKISQITVKEEGSLCQVAWRREICAETSAIIMAVKKWLEMKQMFR